MKPRTLTTSLAMAGVTIGLLAAPVIIGPQGITDQNAFAAKKKVRSTPIYKPPKRGAPGGRLGGGTRGFTLESPALVALAPDHVGLTAREQPTLFWYTSKTTDRPFELTLIEDHAINPIVEVTLPPPTQPGVQRIRLSDYGVRLSTGTEYQWFVALVLDENHRSKDILTGGKIERVDLPESVLARLAHVSHEKSTAIYAEAGYWYEAIAAASDAIDASSHPTGVRDARASLLEQVGLKDVAATDRMPH